MPALHATAADFDSIVLASPIPVIVDFWAEWCGPCRAMGPDLDAVAEEMAGKVAVVKVNADNEPELASRYNVRGLPTLLMFSKGEAVDINAGAMPGSRLRAWASKPR